MSNKINKLNKGQRCFETMTQHITSKCVFILNQYFLRDYDKNQNRIRLKLFSLQDFVVIGKKTDLTVIKCDSGYIQRSFRIARD